MGGEFVFDVRNESGDDLGRHSSPKRPTDDEMEAFLRELSPGDWDVYDKNTGPGFRGSYLHVTQVTGRAPLFVDPPNPRKSLAGPRGRKLRALCAEVDKWRFGNLADATMGDCPYLPSWAEPVEGVRVLDMDRVLDALGVP